MSENLLAAARRRAGYTQQTFVAAFAAEAERLGVDAAVSVRQLSRWEKPEPPLPHPGQQALLEALFGIPLQELGFKIPEHRRASAEPGDNGPVQRRRFVADLAAATTAGVVPQTQSPRIGTADLAVLRDRMHRLYHVDHTTGGDRARGKALILGRTIADRLKNSRCTDRIARDLQSMLGETQSHLAWFGRDAGRSDEARAFCLEALATARMVGDPLLETRSLASLTLLAVDRGDAWEATSAASAAHAAAHRSAGPTVLLIVALRDASAAEAAGDLTAARRALTRAVAFQGRTDRDVPAWAAYAGPVEVHYAEGSYYLAAGQPRAAVPFLKAAADGLGDSYARNAAVYRTKLGSALLAAGEPEAACAQVHAVLDHADSITSHVMQLRLLEFTRAAHSIGSATTRDVVDRLRHYRLAGTT